MIADPAILFCPVCKEPLSIGPGDTRCRIEIVEFEMKPPVLDVTCKTAAVTLREPMRRKS